MVENKQWLLHSVFKVNVCMAVAGRKACWAARVLVKLGIFRGFCYRSAIISIQHIKDGAIYIYMLACGQKCWSNS